jgi:endoglucanase
MFYKNRLYLVSAVLFVFLLMMCTSGKRSSDNGAFKIRTGVNISHWLSQSDKRGEERAAYITKSDFDTIVITGFDHVRLPVDEVQLWDSLGNKIPEAFSLLHNAIGWALEDNLRVIVDLHIIRSHYFNAASNLLWTDSAAQEKLVNMWLELSDQMKQYPVDMLAYELMNEAVAPDPDDWNKLFNKVLTAIRVNEPLRKVVIGSNRWQLPETFPDLEIPENDTNLILSFHFYIPTALTHHLAPWTEVAEYKGPVNYPGWIVDTTNYAHLSEKTVSAMRRYANGYFTKDSLLKEMMPAILVAKEKKLPLYCGEFGIYPAIPEEISLCWYKDVCAIFNANGIAYCHWAYKGDFPIVNKKGETNKALVSLLTSK